MKPLGHKNYGSIGHLPNSRLGKGDYHIHEGLSNICQVRARDKHDIIIVQEKLDGSNVGVAKKDGRILALGRSGYLAQSSKFEMHQLFAYWVRRNEDRFRFLEEGQRLVGEWLAYAHGTIYDLPHEPFVAFDLMKNHVRSTYLEFMRLVSGRFVVPRLLHYGSPVSSEWIMRRIDLCRSFHGAQEPIEGAIWRVERMGKVDFLAKYVRHGKEDGKYLDQNIWLWEPS